jgi:F420-0:gamma-glutamyl ligase
MNTNRPSAQNDTAQDGHKRRLQAAKHLLTNAGIDAAVIEYCQSVLDPPGYERSYTQARLDACAARLALAQTDTTTRRTREARQVLLAVSGGPQ